MPFQPSWSRSNDKHRCDRGLLLLAEEIGHQCQWDLMLAGDTPALSGQHRLIGEGPPAALTFDPEQQRRVNLQRQSMGSKTL